MTSLVRQFQLDLISGKKGTTELLRTAKLISAKLGLPSLEEWIDRELRGYGNAHEVPDYRKIEAGILQSRNPYRGWITVTGGGREIQSFTEALSSIEEHAKQTTLYYQPAQNYEIEAEFGDIDVTNFPQRIVLSGSVFKSIVEAVREQLLDWSIELETRGIIGENMSFEDKEKQAAHSTVFNIQSNHGVIGNISNSQIAVYDYSTIHQSLKDAGIPQDKRNEIETLMDELKAAPPEKRPSLLERSREWVVKNEKFLGSAVSIVRKALGIGFE